MKEVWRLKTEDGEEYFFWSEAEARQYFKDWYVKVYEVDDEYPYWVEKVLSE